MNKPQPGQILASHYILQRWLEDDFFGARYLAVHQRTGAYYDVWFTDEHPSIKGRPWDADVEVSRWSEPALRAASPLGYDPSCQSRRILCRPHVARTASALLEQGPQPVELVIALGEQLLRGLGALHARRFTHNTVAPPHLALDTGPAGLTRLGLIHLEEASFEGARVWIPEPPPGVMLPPPFEVVKYGSPEHLMGKNFDPYVCDVYSAGACLFALLAGRAPYQGESLVAFIYDAIQGQAASLRQLRPDAPPALAAVIERAIDRDPTRRFANAQAMAQALSEVSGKR